MVSFTSTCPPSICGSFDQTGPNNMLPSEYFTPSTQQSDDGLNGVSPQQLVTINIPESWNVQQLVSVTVQVYSPASAPCTGLIVIVSVLYTATEISAHNCAIY